MSDKRILVAGAGGFIGVENPAVGVVREGKAAFA